MLPVSRSTSKPMRRSMPTFFTTFPSCTGTGIEYDASFQAAQRSLEIAEQLDDPAAVARAFEMLALACHSLGEWQLGLEFEEQRSAIAGPELDVSDAFDVHL